MPNNSVSFAHRIMFCHQNAHNSLLQYGTTEDGGTLGATMHRTTDRWTDRQTDRRTTARCQ